MSLKLKEKILAAALILGIVLLFNCSKSTAPVSQPKSIYGTWGWQKSVGGFIGGERTPETEGYNLFYLFKTDGTFQLHKFELSGGQSLEIECRFWVAKEKWPDYPDSVEVLYYQNNKLEPQRIEFIAGADLVVLHDLCIDCFDHTLVRIN